MGPLPRWELAQQETIFGNSLVQRPVCRGVDHPVSIPQYSDGSAAAIECCSVRYCIEPPRHSAHDYHTDLRGGTGDGTAHLRPIARVVSTADYCRRWS